MRHLLALDQGTTSSRAIVFDAALNPIATAQRELQQHFPRSGEVEHDPVEIARDQIDCAREAIARAGLTASAIDAIGITNQRETTVIWDRATGVPIHRAIVWQDRRTTTACEALKASGAEALVRATTGLVLDPYFSGTKIAWILDHVPGARTRAERGELAFGTIDTWLIWNLACGSVHATDPSNASRTLLFNIHTGDWDESMLALFRVPRALMPRVVASIGVLGTTQRSILGAAIPIAGIAGDQQAALYGQGCDAPGQAKNTYGTGCFMLMHTGPRAVTSANGLITTRAASGPNLGLAQFALEGSVFIAGAVVQWLRDGLGLISSAHEIEALAAQVSDAGGVQFVPAFAGLGAPHWDARARGTIVGLTRGTTRAHLARAALDAIALQSAELATAMTRDAGLALTELRVDGGATANNLLMQLQADVLGIPVLRPRSLESTALGAAALAARGIAPGEYPSAPRGLIERVFEPTWGADQRASVRDEWDRAIDRARAWASDAS